MSDIVYVNRRDQTTPRLSDSNGMTGYNTIYILRLEHTKSVRK